MTRSPRFRPARWLALAFALGLTAGSARADNEDAEHRASLAVHPATAGTPLELDIRSTELGATVTVLTSSGNGPTIDPQTGLVLHLDANPSTIASGVIPPSGLFQVTGPAAPSAGSRLYLQAIVQTQQGPRASQPATLVVDASVEADFSNGSHRIPNLGPRGTADVDHADMDADGDEDVVLAVVGEAPLLLVNDGTGSFAIGGEFRTFTKGTLNAPRAFGDSNLSTELADVDGNGLIDILLVAPTGRIHLFMNRGALVFHETRFNIELGGSRGLNDLEVGDLDNDGDPDLVVAVGFDSAHSGKRGGSDRLFVNGGAGRFDEFEGFRARPFNLASRTSTDVSMGDIDDDGDLDLFFATTDYANGGVSNVLVRNDGALFFNDLSANLPGAAVDNSTEAEFVDVDGDRDLDLLIAQSVLSASGIALQLNDGSGVFSDGSAQMPDLTFFDIGIRLGMDVADVDLDGDMDVAFAVHEIGVAPGESFLLLNQGGVQGGTQGFFDYDHSFRTFGRFVAPDLAFFDADHDGDQDLYIANTGDLSGRDRKDRLLLNDL